MLIQYRGMYLREKGALLVGVSWEDANCHRQTDVIL